MDFLATTVALVMAAVLLWAGLEKARSLTPTASTLHQLGVPESFAKSGALFLLIAESAVALGLILRPGSAEILTGVVVLAGAFALGGLIALGRDEPILCNCFGAGGSGYLGRSQLVALPFWLAGALLLWLARPAPSSMSEAAVSFAVIGLAIAALRGFTALGGWKEARGDRRSFEERSVWQKG